MIPAPFMGMDQWTLNSTEISLLCNQIETWLNHRLEHLMIKLITTKTYPIYLLILPGLLAMLTSDSCIQTYLPPPPCCCMPTCCLHTCHYEPSLHPQHSNLWNKQLILNLQLMKSLVAHIDKKALMMSNPWCGTVVIHHGSYQ
jgi:hypothetical protein